MTPAEYIKNAIRTETQQYLFGTTGDITAPIEHGVMGLVTESAELMSLVKKSKIYGKALDRVAMAEEAGDVMWYLALLANELGISFEDLWEMNIKKLKQRYPEKFTAEQALNRDHEAERKVLEAETKNGISGTV